MNYILSLKNRAAVATISAIDFFRCDKYNIRGAASHRLTRLQIAQLLELALALGGQEELIHLNKIGLERCAVVLLLKGRLLNEFFYKVFCHKLGHFFPSVSVEDAETAHLVRQ